MVEEYRIVVNEKMAELFEQVDFVIASTNPDVVFAATGPLPTQVGDRQADIGNNGALTIPVQHRRQSRHPIPARSGRPACRSACRSSLPTTPSPPSSTSLSLSSVNVPGLSWPPARRFRSTCAIARPKSR